MADETHLEIIKQGVEAWNRWREYNPTILPDLRKADLSYADLRDAALGGADLSGADLSGADLSEARFSAADLTGANLHRATLHRAFLYNVELYGADFSWADLSGADLNGADFSWVDLRGADLSGAILGAADLSQVKCEWANFSNAYLQMACLHDAKLDEATLTGARLWETQRAGWSIKGVVCESAYWDREGKELTTYAPGEFERLYAEKVKVLVRYPDGINPLEVVTLPALIQHLEASRPGCKLRFESIQDGPGGAVVTIVVDDAEDTPPEQMERLRAEIQAEAEQKAVHLREALESEKESVLLLKGEVRALGGMVDKLLSRPTFYLERGDANVGDEYNIGQAGAVGPHAHAHDMTFRQVGGNIERRMDLSALAGELATLREAMRSEASEPEHDIAVSEVAKAEQAAKAQDSSKVAEGLKAAGKWALDAATKVGTTLASEALKESMGLK